MGYYGIPCKAANWIHCLQTKFIYRLHSLTHDSDRELYISAARLKRYPGDINSLLGRGRVVEGVQ